MREILFYRTWTGRCPAADFMRSLSREQKAKITAALRAVEEDDVVPAQVFKKLTGTEGLWEVRAQFGGDAIRLLGFFDGPTLVVVVSGFFKKTRQIPQAEISTAQLRRQDYFRRKERP